MGAFTLITPSAHSSAGSPTKTNQEMNVLWNVREYVAPPAEPAYSELQRDRCKLPISPDVEEGQDR
eukprot:3713833-Pyramimonas_sp.AAC.1